MNFAMRFARPELCIIGLSGIIIASIVLYFWHRSIMMRYSFVSRFITILGSHSVRYKMLTEKVLRYSTLLLLAIAAGRPQLVDHYSKVHVEGIDIMIALDASSSMRCFDDLTDRRDRFSVAKNEAIRFALNRPDDQIGLVLFGKDAVSRCPLTLDKKIIAEIIETTELGIVNPNGTALSIGLMMALKRLQHSQAKSKVIILLTDGEPTPEFDIAPEKAIALAKKLGVKVYTIGIGNQHGGYIDHPFFGVTSVEMRVNKNLLIAIAQETGGKFFMAEDPEQIRTIYDTINTLEKTSTESPLYTRYTEIGSYFLWLALSAIVIRMIMFTFIWMLIS